MTNRIPSAYSSGVRWLTLALAAVSGVGVLAMMAVTCVDVVLGVFGRSFVGAYDIIGILAAVTIGCALPYTTAVKGHVAIEYFFLKLPRGGRIVVDSLARLLSIALFGFLAWELAFYGLSLRSNGVVSMTMQIPLFWVPWVLSFACAVVALVIVHHLVRPGREMIKP